VKILMLMLMLASSSALSDEKTWFQLQALGIGNDEFQHAISHGFDKDTIAEFRGRIFLAQERVKAQGNELYRDICNNESAYNADPESLAQRFERHEVEYAQLRDGLVDELKASLSASDRAAFEHYQQHMQVTVVDNASEVAKIRSGATPANVVTSRACVLAAAAGVGGVK